MNLSKGWALDTIILLNDVTRMMKEDVTGAHQEIWVGSTSMASIWMVLGWTRKMQN